jgi:uncharacterized glyoxalase superfamily protein PhnB
MRGDWGVLFGAANPAPGVVARPASLSFSVPAAVAVDGTYPRARAAGGSSVSEPADQFYGYRAATVKDPGGNKWTICAVVEQLTSEEMHRRMDEMMKGSG